MAERFSCALSSRLLGEPCYGTASQARRWLLLEQPGPWGTDAVMQSRLPPEVAIGLRAVARAVGARLLVIRRPGRSAPIRRTCFAVVSTDGVRRIERFTVGDPADLLGIDWEPLRGFAPVGGEVVDHPLYLVCTNGSHDTCCARFGRPVARVLHETLGDGVWEASHYGGDRFAGNLVCLPDGIYYGRVAPEEVLALVEQHQAGRLVLDHYRGRSFLPFVAQAAEHFVREDRGLTRVDDVVAQRVDAIDDGRFRVGVVTSAGEAMAAVVECTEAIDPQQLTCRSSSEEHPPRYRLVDLS
ncbi:MAG: sucrase ferredoxin [Actinomycetota bacterium]|nr:sucrase ferredoxin [Actinomycetota bacterium]